jgi:phosphopantothenoylcysteine decarboxylase/phosphopantothenate--cysteine ligase
MSTVLLKNKKILLGITGGISAYKVCELIRMLKKHDCAVKIIMTDAATEFIKPLTFEILSENRVYNKMFGESRADVEHISLARWADCVVVAPATANCIAKLAHGIADDLLSTVLLAIANIPIAMVPAMNREMWNNQATQANMQLLRQRNIHIFGPETGLQACGEIGEGRMLEVVQIFELISSLFLLPLLKDKTVLVTAGPTVEPIDPVRYISNRSSGKMGYATACAAAKFGSKVILISGPTNLSAPANVTRINVITAEEMFDAVMANVSACDIFISVAAVADYKVEKSAMQKIKKSAEELELKLCQNPDILAEVAKLDNAPLTVGFAAETEDVMANAKAKLHQKNVDIIVANAVGENTGFDSDINQVTVLTKRGVKIELGPKSKELLAVDLIKAIMGQLQFKK